MYLVYWIFFPICIIPVVYPHSFPFISRLVIHNILVTLVATHTCLYHVSLYAHYEPTVPLPPTITPRNFGLDWLALHCTHLSPDCYARWCPIYSDFRYFMSNDSGVHASLYMSLRSLTSRLINATDSGCSALYFHLHKPTHGGAGWYGGAIQIPLCRVDIIRNATSYGKWSPWFEL